MTKKQKARADEYWTYPNMARALEIALYYGFTPANPVTIEKSDHEHVKSLLLPEPDAFIRPEEKAALIRTHFSGNENPQPVMLATVHEEHKHGKLVEYSYDIIGTSRSIADATLLKTLYETLRAEGHTNINLELNSIGDRESFVRYIRELGAFCRKHAGEMNAECRQAVKKDPQAILACSHDECSEFKERLPHSMNYLSEPSRAYFTELLELLEMSDIPFALNTSLIANRECAMHTVFRITSSNGDKEEVIAYGSRWGVIGRKMGFRKDVQGMSGTMLLNRPEKSSKMLELRKPMFYFIQMGQEAKLKSLRVIEVLRQSKIPVYHSLIKDKFTAQLSSAEILKVPYILIMGQKESLENTVLIREMSNRCQETVRMDRIAEHLRKIID